MSWKSITLTSPSRYEKLNVDDNDLNKKKKDRLILLNKIGCILHLLSGIAAVIMIIIFASDSYQTRLTTDFTKFNEDALSEPGHPESAGPFSVILVTLGFYRLIFVDLMFPFITSLFHGLIAWNSQVKDYYLKRVFIFGGNPLRWIEYSITASLMTWVILQLSGVTNVLTLILVGVICNIAMQAQGHLMEVLNSNMRYKPKKKYNWIPMIIGFLILVGQWMIIAAYFFAAVTSGNDVPWFVYSIIIGLFFQFAGFGFVLVAKYIKSSSFKWIQSDYGNEILFIILSFTSKLYLTWNLLIGIALNQMSSL